MFGPRANAGLPCTVDHSRMITPAPSSKVLLVKDRRLAPAEPRSAVLRRYRLARLRLDGRPTGPDSRYEHLKRAFD
jgi:hypothetical protein